MRKGLGRAAPGEAPSFAGPDDLLYRRAAARNGLAFAALTEDDPPADPRRLTPHLAMRLGAARVRLGAGRVVTAVAPREADLTRALADLGRGGGPPDLVVTTPRRLRRSLAGAVADAALAGTRDLLRAVDPELSAARTPSPAIRVLVTAGAAATVAAFVCGWRPALVAICLVSAALFHVAAGMRVRMTFDPPRPVPPPPPLRAAALPAYSVLVCLYREAAMVPGLAAALKRLDWPADRLQVLVLTEADDPMTTEAARAAFTGPNDSVLVVPPGTPRTKPRALAYGTAFVTGDLVTVFDAEDRPAPDQLRRAAAALLHGPATLACVQAELRIDGDRTLLQKLFAIDYAVQFAAVLPWFAAGRVPLPLGGTSNHFHRRALEACHGWDPFNVTEDADLGLRLARYGFDGATVDSVTYETAPDRLAVWLPQRTRWLKGWMVTWLVHGRRPLSLVFELGLRRALLVHGHAVSQVLAPLTYPFAVASLVLHGAGIRPLPDFGGIVGSVFLGILAFGFVVGHGIAVVLARQAVVRIGRRDLLPWTWALPVHWLLVSLAAWIALRDLVLRPHHWAKTPHDPHGTPRPPRRRRWWRRWLG